MSPEVYVHGGDRGVLYLLYLNKGEAMGNFPMGSLKLLQDCSLLFILIFPAAEPLPIPYWLRYLGGTDFLICLLNAP